jgi:hypothetical protein
MSPFHPAALALAIITTAYASTPAPVPLTGGELKALCTTNLTTIQRCAGYVAGVSDEMELIAKGAARLPGGAGFIALAAPCPGKQLAEQVAATLKELNTSPNALRDTAFWAVQSALHPPLGCDGSGPSSPEISVFADGGRLKQFCTGDDRNERLQCDGYIRAVTDEMLIVLKRPAVRNFASCTPTWQTSDQAVSATIVYLNAHAEQEKSPAPNLIEAALFSPSCPLSPVTTPSAR